MERIAVIPESELEQLFIRAVKLGALQAKDEIKPTSEIMTKTELKVYLRCSVSKIDSLMKKGLPYFMFGEHPRFRKSRVDEWLEGQE